MARSLLAGFLLPHGSVHVAVWAMPQPAGQPAPLRC